MKQFFLTFIIILAARIFTSPEIYAQTSPHPELELYSSFTMNIPKTVYKKEDFTLSTFNLIYGIKLIAKPFDLRYYHGSNTIKFSEASGFQTFNDFQDLQKKPAWSVSLDLAEIPSVKKIPLSISFGTLSYSQAVSRLRSPSFYSNPSPLSDFSPAAAGIGITLAQKTAGPKPFSVAAAFNGKNFTVQAAVSEEKNFTSGAAIKLQPGRFVKNSISLGFTTFDLSSPKATGWKITEPQFTDQKAWGTYLETSFSIPLFMAKAGFGTVKNPFNTLRFWTTFESMFHYHGFNLLTGVFVSDRALSEKAPLFYTASGNKEKSVLQFKLNPQKFFYINSALFKTGICALYDYSQEHKLSIFSGTSVKTSKNYFSLLYKMQNISFQQEFDPTHSMNFKYSRYFKKLTLSLSAKESFSDQELKDKGQHDQTFSIYAGFKNFPISSLSFSSELHHKNSSVTPEFAVTTATSIPLKNLKISGKIRLCTTVLVE